MTRILTAAAALLLASPAFAQQAAPAQPAGKAAPATKAEPAKPAAPPAAAPAAAAPAPHVMLAPADLKWGPTPPGLPANPKAQAAVLFGDPGKPGLFLIRAKFPAGYRIPAHWHTGDETVTVISGSVAMGMGEKPDEKTAKPMPAGSFMGMPGKTHHSLLAKTAAVIQVAGVGPFDITYLDPADDPRNAKSAEAPAPAKK